MNYNEHLSVEDFAKSVADDTANLTEDNWAKGQEIFDLVAARDGIGIASDGCLYLIDPADHYRYCDREEVEEELDGPWSLCEFWGKWWVFYQREDGIFEWTKYHREAEARAAYESFIQD